MFVLEADHRRPALGDIEHPQNLRVEAFGVDQEQVDSFESDLPKQAFEGHAAYHLRLDHGLEIRNHVSVAENGAAIETGDLMQPVGPRRVGLDAKERALAILICNGSVDETEVRESRVVRLEPCERVLLRFEQNPAQFVAINQRVDRITVHAVEGADLQVHDLRMPNTVVRKYKIEIEAQFRRLELEHSGGCSAECSFDPFSSIAPHRRRQAASG